MARRPLPKIGIWNRDLFDDFWKRREKLINKIFDAQERLGWTDKELSFRSNVSVSAIHAIYWGNSAQPYSGTLYKLCRAVGVECTI